MLEEAQAGHREVYEMTFLLTWVKDNLFCLQYVDGDSYFFWVEEERVEELKSFGGQPMVFVRHDVGQVEMVPKLLAELDLN